MNFVRKRINYVIGERTPQTTFIYRDLPVGVDTNGCAVQVPLSPCGDSAGKKVFDGFFKTDPETQSPNNV